MQKLKQNLLYLAQLADNQSQRSRGAQQQLPAGQPQAPLPSAARQPQGHGQGGASSRHTSLRPSGWDDGGNES